MDSSANCLEDTSLEAGLAALDALELDMPALQARANGVFALATAWTERHDAILAATPAASLGVVEARLRRMGIRWGMAPGVRMTGQIPALPADATNDP
ncbi:hypothetical protein [Thermomonas fusca]|uniref:Uncharacterized protein n=1 Tax=Thermomonas fusca TaxID=215690 RepID=A0A5R9PI34_9GAMM|nr:hypothetical protein [Thermomonas fusca]TLX22876.1 hypothetical protein E5S66_02290 [Thermomonas fusca]